jgi:hypothetical protein
VHVALAIGATVALADVIVARALGVDNVGTRSDSLVCADFAGWRDWRPAACHPGIGHQACDLRSSSKAVTDLEA